jgi:hypothetical protein
MEVGSTVVRLIDIQELKRESGASGRATRVTSNRGVTYWA